MSILATSSISYGFHGLSWKEFAKVVAEKEFYFTRDSLHALVELSRLKKLQPWVTTLSLNGARLSPFMFHWGLDDEIWPAAERLETSQEGQQHFWSSGELQNTLVDVFSQFPNLCELRLSPATTTKHIPNCGYEEYSEVLDKYFADRQEDPLQHLYAIADNNYRYNRVRRAKDHLRYRLLRIVLTAIVKAGVQLHHFITPVA